MTLSSKSIDQHSSLAFYSVGTAIGVIAATSMFFSNNFGFSRVIASTTIQNENDNSNSTSQFDTSKIELGTGDYAFQSTDASVVNISGNSLDSSFVTNVKNIEGNIVYSDSSQFIVIYNTGEDLSGATYTITNTSDDSVISSGHFTTVSVSGKSYDAMCLPSSVIQAGFSAEQTSQGKLRITVTNGSTKTSYLRTLAVKTMSGTASMQLPTVTDTEDDQNASAHFKNQAGTIVDANNQKIGSVALSSSDITVAQDAKTPKDYTYSLNSSGINKVNTALDTINQTALSSGGIYYTLDTATTGKITLKQAAPVKTTLNIKYVDAQGKTVKTDTVNGNVGDQGSYTAQVPKNYELADGQSQTTAYTLTDSANQLTIKLEPQATTLAVNYTDENGNVVKTDTVKGNIGDQGSYTAQVPTNYELADGQSQTTAYTLTDSTNKLTVKLEKVEQPQATTLTVNYADKNGNVVKTDTIKGNIGDKGTYNTNVPNNYTLAAGQAKSVTYALAKSNTPLTIKISKIPVKQVATLKINYTDANGAVVKTDTINGKIGDSGVYNAVIPAGYTLVNSKQRAIKYTLTANSTPLSIAIKAVAAKATNPPADKEIINNLIPSLPVTPDHNTIAPSNSAPNINPVQTRKSLVTATVLYIDGITGKTLATEILTGEAGERIIFDTYKQIFKFQHDGYYIVRDDTMRLNAAYFTSTPMTYRVVLERQKFANNSNSSMTQPSKAPTLEQQRTKSTHTINSERNHSRNGHKHSTKRPQKEQRTLTGPVIFDKEIDAILAISGRGSGHDKSDVSELGKFFISLSGTINFGVRNN